jgi:predicted dehydrogenase
MGSDMLKYGAAIIGLGNIAWKYDGNHPDSPTNSRTHAGAYLQCDRTRLIGGCSIDPHDRKAFQQSFSVPVFKDHNRMLADLNPDIISICSPSEHHFEQAMDCMEAGVPMIWLEKPPTTTLEQLYQLVDRQNQLGNKTKILVGYQRRYMVVFRKLRDIFQNGILGNIDSIQVNYSLGLMNNGSHYIDLLFFLFGDSNEPELRFAVTDNFSENPTFGLLFPNGPMVIFNGIDVHYHCMDISITGELGRISVLYGGIATRWEEKVEQDLFPGNFRLREKNENPLGEGGFLAVMLEELKDLIRSHENKDFPLSNLETSLNTLKVLEKVWEILGQKGC